MPTPPLTRSVWDQTNVVIEDALRSGFRPPGVQGHGNGALAQAASVLRLSPKTLVSRVAAAKRLGYPEPDWTLWRVGGAQVERDGAIELPRFPKGKRTAVHILDYMESGYADAAEYQQAVRWFEVKIKDKLPIGICWFGDPHLGSNGCNVSLLRRDIRIVTRTDGMYAANIGDTTDNWGGRLIREYANNDVSRETEKILAKWFLQEAGIPWLLWLKGNHDVMDGAFSAYLDGINATQVPLIDWRAKFKVTFPNGRTYRIDAAHDFKGHSLWNEMHALDRASLIEEHADFYVAGHRHDWGTKQKELPTGRVATLLRVSGYKKIDAYATKHQYDSKNYGAAGLIILDPEERFHPAFADLESGADYLRYLRKRRK